MIQHSMFVIAVADLAASSAFYRDALGFDIHEIGDPGWRMFSRDNCRIMAGACPDAMPAHATGDHSYFAYLVVDNAEQYYQTVCDYGVELIKLLRNEPWGMREFGLRTIDGHRIMVGQDLDE